MPYIRVRPEGLQRMSEMLDRVEKDIEQREEAFSIVSRNLDWQVKREEDIDWQLRCICIELQEEKQKIAEIAEYLRRASVIYEKLEKNLQDEDERSLSYGTVYDQNEQETPFGTAYVAVYSWLLEVSKNIMKAVSEKNKDEITGLAGDLVSYCDSLIKFFTGDSKHAPFGIGQWCKLSKASASVWKGFYTVFKKSFSDEKPVAGCRRSHLWLLYHLFKLSVFLFANTGAYRHKAAHDVRKYSADRSGYLFLPSGRHRAVSGGRSDESSIGYNAYRI